MKKDIKPLIVAIFLVAGGLLSGVAVLKNKTGVTEVASVHQGSEFFVSVARGAENAATLFGSRMISPVTAVSDNSALNKRSVFSVTLGAVKDPGISIGKDAKNLTSEISSLK